jgi:hypothetical protein
MGEQHANGWQVSRHWLVADATVGVIANPIGLPAPLNFSLTSAAWPRWK